MIRRAIALSAAACSIVLASVSTAPPASALTAWEGSMTCPNDHQVTVHIAQHNAWTKDPSGGDGGNCQSRLGVRAGYRIYPGSPTYWTAKVVGDNLAKVTTDNQVVAARHYLLDTLGGWAYCTQLTPYPDGTYWKDCTGID